MVISLSMRKKRSILHIAIIVERVFKISKHDVTIRPIEAKDDQAIYEIIQKILEEYDLDVPGTAYYDPQLATLSEYYQTLTKGEYWVLVQDQEVIGGVGIGPFGDHEGVAELQKFYIMEAYQGEGYGSLLYKMAEDFAKTEGYANLYIETIDTLGSANEIYEYFGFKALSEPLSGSEHGLMNRWFIKSLKSN